MGRMNMRPREAAQPKRELSPAWGGVGCLLVLLFTVGCYFAADWSIDAMNAANSKAPFLPSGLRAGIPHAVVVLLDYQVPPATRIGSFQVPRPIEHIVISFDMVAMAITLFLALIIFSLISLVWAALHPKSLGPKDAPPIHSMKDINKPR